jgi:hypothetical protein
MVNLKGIPTDYHNNYIEIIILNHAAFCDDTYYIGRATILQQQTHLKNPLLIYVKHIKIAHAYKDYLEDQVKEWIKMGTI